VSRADVISSVFLINSYYFFPLRKFDRVPLSLVAPSYQALSTFSLPLSLSLCLFFFDVIVNEKSILN